MNRYPPYPVGKSRGMRLSKATVLDFFSLSDGLGAVGITFRNTGTSNLIIDYDGVAEVVPPGRVWSNTENIGELRKDFKIKFEKTSIGNNVNEAILWYMVPIPLCPTM